MSSTAPRRRFVPSEVEPRWSAAWAEAGVGHADPESDRPAFSIAIPPPNVTGALHMGHALNNTIQDVLCRTRRMAGDEVEWICGTDHAGIATQAVVEKALAAEGIYRKELGREEFVRRVWEWKEEYGGQIIGQLKRLGCTLDYSRERFTMDERLREGRAPGVRRPSTRRATSTATATWSTGTPGCGSAISDLEVEEREVTDTLVRIAYPLTDGSGEIVVATVRPETMLGDTAVAVNPDDERYRDLIGRTVTLPLVGPRDADRGRRARPARVRHRRAEGHARRTTPTTSRSPSRHGLPAVDVIGEDGRMTADAGELLRRA